MENKKQALIKGYAVSSRIKSVLNEEGYVALRIVEKDNNIKPCEAVEVYPEDWLPLGSDTILDCNKISIYSRILVLDKEFFKGEGVEY